MRAPVELDPINFHRMLHAVLRADESAAEIQRSDEVLRYVSENVKQVLEVLESNQIRLFGRATEHWRAHGTATNRVFLEEMARLEDMPDGLIALLEEYDSLRPSFKLITALDMPQVMSMRVEDWERVRMLGALKEAQQITMGAVAPKKQGDKRLKGARDAQAFLFQALSDGVIVPESRAVGGSLKERLPDVMDSYQRNKDANGSGRLQIETQLSGLDNTIRGFRRGEFVGVMGFAGQYKTTVCRTFVYNAAQQGYRCLHIPLESSYEEELMLYSIMHSHERKFYRNFGIEHRIDRQSFDDGQLSAEEEAFLEAVVIPDFKQNIKGDIIIRQPSMGTWAEMRQMIELEDRKAPLDLVLIDYLALVNVADSRNPTATINETIKQAKSLSLNLRNCQGVTILTPVQGKREGWEQAKENDGIWQSDAAYMYSEFEKSLDKMLYVYTDDAMQNDGHLKIGACKSRRSINAPPTTVERHSRSGRICDLSSRVTSPAMMADLQRERAECF